MTLLINSLTQPKGWVLVGFYKTVRTFIKNRRFQNRNFQTAPGFDQIGLRGEFQLSAQNDWSGWIRSSLRACAAFVYD